MTSSIDFRRRFVLLVIGLACVGCGEKDPLAAKRGSVSGTVTFDGQPVEEGRITFTPVGTEGQLAGAEIKDGKYTIPLKEGPVAGQHKVSIVASRKTGEQREAPMPAPPGTKIEVKEEYIPLKYNRQTTLTADIKAGENKDVDFKLDKG